MGIVGVGNLGSALLQNQNFPARGFYFVAAFDSDAEKIGKNVFPGLVIRNVEKLKDTVEDSDIEIGVITTPASVAQGIADLFLEANVNALLNFSPTQLHVPEGCLVESIDFTIKLDILTYKLKHELRI
jgi:redox-sensing transcriptional repressor